MQNLTSNRLSTIVTCANDANVPEANLLFRSLRETAQFKGDIILLSDALDDHVAEAFQNLYGVQTLFHQFEIESELIAVSEKVARWASRLEMGRDPWGRHMASKTIKNEAAKWRRKHLHKLLIRDYFVQGNVADDDAVLLLDSDIVAQGPVSPLSRSLKPGQMTIGLEWGSSLTYPENSSPVFFSNLLLRGRPEFSDLKFGKDAQEPNVGFMLATRATFEKVFALWVETMKDPDLEFLWTAHEKDFWHEQDFFRLLFNRRPDLFHIVGTEAVFHACGGAESSIDWSPEKKAFVKGGRTPLFVHFCGRKAKQNSIVAKMNTESAEHFEKAYQAIVASPSQSIGSDQDLKKPPF